MKCEQINSKFKLQTKKEGVWIVRPFNGEEESNKHLLPYDQCQVSWSHGFTHFLKLDDGSAHHCGTNFFEENATLIKE